ncbi:hypothetical protein BOVA514_1759 [Bacteroides ovatus]|nr:hypothetical protein BOVA514_1759 [Bacteroides ovatus]
MHCKDTILRTQNNWPYSKLIPNSGILFYPGKIFKDTLDDMSITRRVEIKTDYTDGSSNGGTLTVTTVARVTEEKHRTW